MNTEKARKLVIEAGLKLMENGLIARTWGNVSCRIDENHFVITPSGKNYESLTPEDIVKVRIDNLEYEGRIKPSSERGIHASVYKLKKDIDFVIHTHQMNASSISSSGINSFNTNGRYSLMAENIPMAGYGLPGTKNLRKNVEKALSQTDGKAVVMKKHGALCYGESLEEAFEAALQLEKVCDDFIRDSYVSSSGNWLFNPIKLGSHVLGTDIKFNGSLNVSDEYIINDSPYAVACSYMDKPLFPYLDDFAQIVGPRMTAVENDIDEIKRALEKTDAVFVKGFGAVCAGEDKEAVSMIVEKNCRAYLVAKMVSSVAKPINALESNLMRMVYLKKYSRQMTKA